MTKRVRGSIGRVAKDVIRGWATKDGSDLPVELDLLINNKKISTVVADEFRKRLANNSQKGKCGFSINLKGTNQLPSICSVEVQVSGKNEQLINSPYVYNEFMNNSILVVGLAKSGTSILTYKIAEAMDDKRLYFEPRGHDGLLDRQFHESIMLKKGATNIVTKSIFAPGKHNAYDVRRVASLYNKKIWIVREPRDNIISSFFYRWNKDHNKPEEEFKVALEKTKKKENDPKSISFKEMTKGIFQIEKYLEYNYGPCLKLIESFGVNWHVLKYEDLIEGKIDDLNDYLGFSIANNAEVPVTLSRVVRSKNYGNWRKWFLPEDVKLLKPVFAPYLKALGYDPEDWNLEENPVLDPKQGSEYMNRIFYRL